MSKREVYLTEEECPECGTRLLELKPDYHKWRYWCTRCNELVMLESEVRERLEEAKRRGGIGIVCRIPAPFDDRDAERFLRAVLERRC